MLAWFSERHHVTGASLGDSKIKIIYETIAKRAATMVLLVRMKVITEQICYLATTWPASIRLAATVWRPRAQEWRTSACPVSPGREGWGSNKWGSSAWFPPIWSIPSLSPWSELPSKEVFKPWRKTFLCCSVSLLLLTSWPASSKLSWAS